MAIDYDRLIARQFPDIVCHYGWRETVLYALGVGVGSEPTWPCDLRYVYEKGLQALPTMPVILGHPGFWVSEPDTGINFSRVVHGEHALEIHAPLPPEGILVAHNSVDEIIDKGEGRGMILRVRRDLVDQASGTLQSTQIMSMFCRDDGGFGGPPAKPATVVAIPDRAPDRSAECRTVPQAALIYRLSGDLNPLHADPEAARAAGFDRPILHGLATFGIAGFALLTACADGRAEALRSLSCRFSAPVFPGETIRTDIWEEEGATLFRCTALQRGSVVLDRGTARFA